MSDNINPKTRNRYFSSGLSLMYNGNKYPAAETSILNDDGTTTKRNVGLDANNNYFYIENGQPHIVESLYPMDEVTITGKMPTSVKAANQQKQAYMRAAGYNVPQDGSWNEEQQAIWDNLTIKPKEYDTTLIGLGEGLWDKYSANTTERTNPLDQGYVKAYNPNDVDWGKTRRSQNKVVNAVSGTWGPIVAAATAPALASNMVSAPIATIATLGGDAAGGYAVNKASEALTGRDFGTNVAMHTPLTPSMGEMLNPGYAVGAGYGNFVGNNLANRERYVLNYLTPASYEGHGKEIIGMLLKPFYEKSPTFNNGRKPVWYSDYASKEGIDAAEQRFQNGLVWANIPEEEAAHPMYIQNKDGSYRLTPEGIGYKGFPADALPNETENTADFFTRSGVGGEHSDYTKVAERNGIKLMQFEDEQKLNPQWKMASKIKDKLHIEDNSKAGRFVDYFGGKPRDWLLGYKPFTIKQNYLHNDRAILPIFNDPNDTYVPNWVVAGSVGRQ